MITYEKIKSDKAIRTYIIIAICSSKRAPMQSNTLSQTIVLTVKTCVSKGRLDITNVPTRSELLRRHQIG